ncbi:hypothetical protein BDF14DRAFT_1735563, partial [Spinellus fusiger]
SSSRVFCPLVLYHDINPSSLTMALPTKDYQRCSMIDKHKEKTVNRLNYYAQIWTTQMNQDNIKEVLMCPSASISSSSTASDASWASQSSCDSIATIDSPPQTMEPMIYSLTPPFAKEPSPALSPAYVTKKRRRGNLPREVTDFLKHWLIQHKAHPYPSEKEKGDLAYRTGLTVNQISNWFINARRRILQPMIDSEHIIRSQWMSYPESTKIDIKKRRQLNVYAQYDLTLHQRPQLPNFSFIDRYSHVV